MSNLFLTLASYVAPPVLGLLAVWWLGGGRGVVLGAVLTLVAVFVLLLMQVTPAESGEGSGFGARVGLALGLMRFSALTWVGTFALGAGAGLALTGRRGRG